MLRSLPPLILGAFCAALLILIVYASASATPVCLLGQDEQGVTQCFRLVTDPVTEPDAGVTDADADADVTDAEPLDALPIPELDAGQPPAQQFAWTPYAERSRTLFTSASGNGDCSNTSPCSLPTALQRMRNDTTLLLKRGDTYRTGLGTWSWSRTSVRSWGSGPRPVFELGGERLVYLSRSRAAEDLDFRDFDLRWSERVPGDPNFRKIVTPRSQRPPAATFITETSVNGLLLENFRVDGYAVGFEIYPKSSDPADYRNVRIRGAAFENFYTGAPENRSGWAAYVHAVDGLLIEGVTFNRVGGLWCPRSRPIDTRLTPGFAQPELECTYYMHALYVNGTVRNARLQNIFSAYSGEISLRSGGVVSDLVSWFSHDAILHGGGDLNSGGRPGGVSGRIERAAIVRPDDLPSHPKGAGVRIRNTNALTIADSAFFGPNGARGSISLSANECHGSEPCATATILRSARYTSAKPIEGASSALPVSGDLPLRNLSVDQAEALAGLPALLTCVLRNERGHWDPRCTGEAVSARLRGH